MIRGVIEATCAEIPPNVAIQVYCPGHSTSVRHGGVGPDRSLFRERFGGFVDPNYLMIDRLRCGGILPNWDRPLATDPEGMSGIATSSRRY